MGGSKRPSKAKPPSGEEKKNQLDLFFDWANRAAAATAAAKEAATKKFEELWAAFDKRLLSICGVQCALLAACSYRAPSPFSVVVAVSAALSASLLVMFWIASRIPSCVDRAARVGNILATVLLIVSIVSLPAEIAMPFLSTSLFPPAQHVTPPQIEPPLVSATPDEKSLTEEAQKEAAARAEKDAARVAECLSKEKSAAAARRKHSGREKDFARCRTDYEATFTFKSLDAYCSDERRRLDEAARALNAAVGNMCNSTGSTK